MRAIVLLSGGQDSTTCLYWAKMQFSYVEAIGFDYGQKHKQEIIQAQKIADIAGVKYTVLKVQGALGGSALVDHSQDITAEHAINKNLPASFTAGRNITFLSIAAGYAYNKSITEIVTGVCQTDYSGYPDCRSEFIQSMQKAINLGLGTWEQGYEMRIHTPLMWLTKAETWKLARDIGCLDVIINHTLTDYNGCMDKNEWGYGKNDNPATELRVKGFYEARQKGWI